MTPNKSTFVDTIGAPFRIAPSPMPLPGPHDNIIKNAAVAINTIDPFQARSGFKVLPTSYPIVLGSDVAGTISALGSSVTKFKIGDRVVGHAWVFLSGYSADGAFSLYTRVPSGNATVFPENVTFKEAVVLPMAVDTAGVGLYGDGYLGVEMPRMDAKANGKVMVIYGGSTSVGAAAIQLAVNAGYRRDAGVAGQIAEAVGEDKFIGLWNAIGVPESFEVVIPIMQKLGGGLVANTKPPPNDLPENIQVKFVLGIDKCTWPLWELGFLTEAMEKGRFKCLPEPLVVGKGLESLQVAFEVREGYISGKKVVVEL